MNRQMPKQKPGKKHPLADCDNCPLKDQPLVPSTWVKSATRAVVGEAPVWTEVKALTPFVGPSGQLLNSLLHHVKVNREEITVTNAVLCQIPDLFPKGKLRVAINCCRPRLHSEIKQSRDILALGATALHAILGRYVPISRARGFIWRINGFTVYPSVHPAFVLRTPAWEPVLVNDVDRWARSGASILTKLKPILAPPIEKLGAILARLKGKHVAVDVETTKEPPTVAKLLCVGLSDGKRTTVVIPWASTRSPTRPWYGGRQREVRKMLNQALEGAVAVTHNGPGFDQIVLARYGIEL